MGHEGGSPPGSRAPKVWQFLRLIADPIGYAEACQARYGPVFTVRMLLFDRVVLASDPEDVKAILTDSERFQGGDVAGKLLEPIAGATSVLGTSGEVHMRQRKLLLPSMHEELIGRWTDRIEAIAGRELAGLPVGRPISIRPTMQRITLEVMCRLVFGAESEAQTKELGNALARFLSPRFAPLLFFPSALRSGGRLNPAAPFVRRRAVVHGLVAELIAKRRRDPRLEDRDDVLSLLLRTPDEDGNPITDAELRDQVMTVLVAGYESTATGLTWACERLSRNREAQDRLAAEVSKGEGDEYLNAVVKEALRTRPPLVNAGRRTTREVTVGGRRVDSGTAVAAMFSLTHRRPDLWPDPLDFKPERFLDGKPLPYSFVPFGGGIRRCVGAALATLEMRLVLKTVIARHAIGPAPGREEKARLAGVVLIPAKGGRLVLERRRP